MPEAHGSGRALDLPLRQMSQAMCQVDGPNGALIETQAGSWAYVWRPDHRSMHHFETYASVAVLSQPTNVCIRLGSPRTPGAFRFGVCFVQALTGCNGLQCDCIKLFMGDNTLFLLTHHVLHPCSECGLKRPPACSRSWASPSSPPVKNLLVVTLLPNALGLSDDAAIFVIR